jgi:Effector protein
MGGDPGNMSRLSEPAWGARRYGGERHARPVRVSETRRRSGPAPKPDAAARIALVDRIANGKSSVGIDVSQFKINPGREDAPSAQAMFATGQRLREQYLGYMKDLAATDAGFRLLSDLDKSAHKTVIKFDFKGSDNHTRSDGTGGATNGKGEAPTIIMNPNQLTFQDLKGHSDAPWMSERPKYGFYHELVHAWHISRGTQATGLTGETRNAEWQAVGFGKYADKDVNENAIRRAMGKAERPDYNGYAPPRP